MELKYQENILTPFQKVALKELFESYQEFESFYLTGGTAKKCRELQNFSTNDSKVRSR